MFNYPEKKYLSTLLILTFLIALWFVTTEIIIPGNRYLPAVSLIVISIRDLFSEYKFFYHLISTLSVIYLAFILSFFIVKIKFSYLNLEAKVFRNITPVVNIFLFVPEIIIGLLLIMWLEDKYLAKFIFALFINAMLIYKVLLKFDKKSIMDRILAAQSVGISNRKINQYIIWKFIEPRILKDFKNKQTFLWSSLLAFEFIQNYYGIGFTLRNALQFDDLSIIVSVLIICSLIIFSIDRLLLLIIKKYFNWTY